jgi:radical SAM protein with 4Fe4S-binding SPASM domain
MDAMEALRAQGLPFVVQTTVTADNHGEAAGLAELALNMGARALNLYFLVPTGRGRYVSNISPQECEELLEVLRELESRYQGRLIVSAKCMPHYQRLALEPGPATVLPRGYQGSGGCPAAIHYCAIAPTGDVLPCPYLPISGGNLREQSLVDIWSNSDIFCRLRERGNLIGRCGECQYQDVCGGCRARAFGTFDDPMAEDPLCLFKPGTSTRGPRVAAAAGASAYGSPVSFSMVWTPEAQERLGRVPAILRGLVVSRVESYARGKASPEVTAELMGEARNSMPGRRPAAGPLSLLASKLVAPKKETLAKRRSPER